jgi:two-component system CheB/CheR fusion protein
VASGGDEALALLERIPVDLLLCDLGMPGMDGFDLIDRLRAHPRLYRLAAIALTGYMGASVDPRARAAGFDAYLTKPVSLDAVIAAAQQVLSERGLFSDGPGM